MRRTAFLSSLSPFGKLLLLFGIVIVFAVVTAFAGLVAGMVIYNATLAELSNFISNPVTPNAVSFLKFYQMINQIGIFILPVFFYTFLVSNSSFKYLSVNKAPMLISILVGGLVIYTILPTNNYLDELNRNMNLPDFLSGIEDWMQEKENKARKLTEILLSTSSITGLTINIIIVAIIPAIGEELLFRGLLLKLFNELAKNIHIAVLVSAIIFSAIHFQFYGFLPRLMLGMILGYLYVFTANLWVPIFVHFLNNASSTIIYYLHYNGYIKISMEDFGASSNVAYIIGSLLITLWLMSLIYQKEGSNRITKTR
ncbi:MAG: CPBP family intramembrane metalloprotease [Bacteroidetes bacterium]|nr:CPBP family intramembrane metalloprotease [Bacteroidota bacterium]MBL6943169.1 CPBP family intramembrane metalloprotease [Bacteroidales bacterium]